MKYKTSRGFTLIELMIVVVVLALLATIAVNSYRDSVVKARRAEAKADLLELAQLIERFYTENNSFATLNTAWLPFGQTPRTGTAMHNLTLGGVTATTYTLSATPTGTHTDALCGTLTLNQAGVRGESGSGTVATCWER